MVFLVRFLFIRPVYLYVCNFEYIRLMGRKFRVCSTSLTLLFLLFRRWQKFVACSWVVIFFALNCLASRRSCFLVFGAGLSFLLSLVVGVKFSLSFSLFVGAVSRMMISSGFGVLCSSWNLLFVARNGEEKISSCCCVMGGGCVSGIIVGSGSDGIMSNFLLLSF